MNATTHKADNYLSRTRRSSIDRPNVLPTHMDDRNLRKPSTSSSVSIGMLHVHDESEESSLPGRISSTSSSTPCCEDVTSRQTSVTTAGSSLMTAMSQYEEADDVLSDIEDLSVFDENPQQDSTTDTICASETVSAVNSCRNTSVCCPRINEDIKNNSKCCSTGRDTGSSGNVKDFTEIIPSGKSAKTKDSNRLSSPDTRPGSDSQMTMGWRPVMPGYRDVHRSTGGAVMIQRTLEVNSYDGSLRDSIPAMPKILAVICFVFNILTPGLGTLLAGLSVLCCSKIRGGGDKVSVIWINTCVTLLQIITTPLFLLGWIWSILWGMSFVSFSDPDECQCFGYVCKQKTTEETPDSRTPENESQEPSYNHRRSTTSITSNGTCVHENELLDIGDEQDNSNSHAEAVPQPIIVLQETPVVLNQAMRHSERRASMQVRRNSRQYGRQNRAESLPHVLLDPQTLENIITRNGAIPAIFRPESEQEYEEQFKSPYTVS